MPIYEYQCNHCHHTFDEMQKITDKPLTTCPNCHQETVVRLVSAAGFQLKGTGWYVTDFKNKNNEKPKQSTDSTSSTTEPAKTETKSTDTTTATAKGDTD